MTEQEAQDYAASIGKADVLSLHSGFAIRGFISWLYNDGYKIESILTGEDYAAQKKDLDRRIADLS